MSAYGTYKACTLECACHECKARGVSCSPCMDCEGIPDCEVNEPYVNGYKTEICEDVK